MKPLTTILTLNFSLLVIFNIAQAATIEKDCSFIDLAESGQSMEGIAVGNQGRNGLCYAYAATHMIDAWRRSHFDSPDELEFTSPIAAGLLQSSIKDKEDHDGGSPCGVINTLRETGVCGLSRLPSTTLTGKPTTQVLDLLEMAYQKGHPLALLEQDNQALEFARGLQEQLKAIGSSAPTLSAQHLVALLERNDEVDFIRGVLLEHNCHPYKFEVDVPRCRNFKTTVGRPEKMLKQWDQLLERTHAQPIGISYNSGVLKNKDGGAHASLVVGRRWSQGRCEYLVHNSWGTSCGKYPWDCELGRIWIPGETLAAKVGGGYWTISSKN